MDSSIRKPEDVYGSSDEEVFFGKTGEKEKKISKRIFHRRTNIFSDSFRLHSDDSEKDNDDEIVREGLNDTANLNISEDSLNFKKEPEEFQHDSSMQRVSHPRQMGDNVLQLNLCTMNTDEAYELDDTSTCNKSFAQQQPLVQELPYCVDENASRELPLLFGNSLRLSDPKENLPTVIKEENRDILRHQPSTYTDVQDVLEEYYIPLKNHSYQPNIKNEANDFVSPQNKISQSPFYNDFRNKSPAIIVESSPEADFFQLDFSFPKPQKLSFETEPSLPPNSNATTSIATLDLHTIAKLPDDDEAIKENSSPSETKLWKRPRALYWSPRPLPVSSSKIPLPENASMSKDKRRFQTPRSLKKWDVVSPVAQYIRNQPLPSLFKTVKPLRDIPYDRIPNSSKEFDVLTKTAVKVDKSPSVLKLPCAQYQLKNQKATSSFHVTEIARKGLGCSSVPKVIRHKGPSKAIHYASHLDQSSLASQKSHISHKLEGESSVNKSVMEFVPLRRTDTINLVQK